MQRCSFLDPVLTGTCLLQVEVNGDITTLQLTSLISQTEYDVAVTPMYDEGPTAPMLGTAITGPDPAHSGSDHFQLQLVLQFVSFMALVLRCPDLFWPGSTFHREAAGF